MINHSSFQSPVVPHQNSFRIHKNFSSSTCSHKISSSSPNLHQTPPSPKKASKNVVLKIKRSLTKTALESPTTSPCKEIKKVNFIKTTSMPQLGENINSTRKVILEPLKKIGEILEYVPSVINPCNVTETPASKFVSLAKPLKDISPRTEAMIQDICNVLKRSRDKSPQTTDDVLSVSITNFTTYSSELKTILMYELTVLTKIKKYVIEKSLQQLKKMDQDLRHVFGDLIPPFPCSSEDAQSLEKTNNGILEICDRLQIYLRTILEIPELPDCETFRNFLDVYNLSPRSSPRPQQRCKSMSLLNFENSLKENTFNECVLWYSEILFRLLQKGLNCKRVMKTEISNYCIRLSKDKQHFEYDCVSSFSDTKRVQLKNTVPISEILDVRNEQYAKSKNPCNKEIIKSKCKHFSFPTLDLSVIKLILPGVPQKRTLEFSIEDPEAFKLWYNGLSLLINKTPNQDLLSKIQFIADFEVNLAFLCIDPQMLEKNYFNPPSYPAPS